MIVIPRYNITNDVNYSYNVPLGLGYILAILKQQGYQVDCINLNHCKGYVKNIIHESLSKKNYDYVCTGNISLRYAITAEIVEAVRTHESNPKIILGGQLITTEPELMLKSLNPDFIIIGEGEETIIELLEYLWCGKDIEEVRGIGYKGKEDNIIITKPRGDIKNLDTLPFPDFEGFDFKELLNNLPANEQFDYPRTYPILGSRGCPFRCSFCYHYNTYRTRTVDNIMEELAIAVRRYEINNIAIYDECLSIKEDRLNEFCKRMQKFLEEIPWKLRWTCQLPVRAVDKAKLEVMKNAGCDWVSYGFESYSPSVLKSMKKPLTPQQIDRVFHETLEVGMGIQANFIFGDIAETTETARETLDYWKKNCMGQVNLGFIQPYPGSEIYEHCIRKGIIKDRLDFIKNTISPFLVLNMTDNMTAGEIRWLEKDVFCAVVKYRKYVRPISMEKMGGGNTYVVETKCPYCKEIIKYENLVIENRYNYGFFKTCRNCYKRYFITSFYQRNFNNLKVFVFDFLKLIQKIKSAYKVIKNKGFINRTIKL